ncbi:MAG: ABC transporter ATP-binding protein [Actinomycetota bacterium]|nr:ABC transporter ATP-binding protein [Actinomycetota bacterium]
MEPVAAAVDVTRTYGTAGRSTSALAGVTASFPAGRVTVVAGPSGSGKSTLLRILGGLDVPSSGEVTVCGKDVSRMSAGARRRLRRSDVAFLFQRPSDNLVSYLTAEQHLRLAAELRSFRLDDPAAAAEDLDLGHILDRRPHELSGGEQQRLGVAQAVVASPPLLLLDEPTAELDHDNADRTIRLLHDVAARGTAVVATSHDRSVVDAADEVVELVDGKVRD